MSCKPQKNRPDLFSGPRFGYLEKDQTKPGVSFMYIFYVTIFLFYQRVPTSAILMMTVGGECLQIDIFLRRVKCKCLVHQCYDSSMVSLLSETFNGSNVVYLKLCWCCELWHRCMSKDGYTVVFDQEKLLTKSHNYNCLQSATLICQ